MHYALQIPMRTTGNANFLRATTTTIDNVNHNAKVTRNGNNLVGMQSLAISESVLVTIRPTVIYYRKPDLSYTNHLHNHILTDHPDHPVGPTSLNALILITLLLFGLRVDVLADLTVARTSTT